MISVSTVQSGYIHSIETCGTVDGPGIRLVIFTAGCPLRCLYCSNLDCRDVEGGHSIRVDELIEEIQKYTSYMRASGGGLTVSGGEPLSQPHFVRELFERCHELGIHTALDTSGYCNLEVAKSVLDVADLILLDIKSFDPAIYKKVTGVELEPTLTLARYLSDIRKPTWIRFVLVPDLTSDRANVEGLADFIATLESVERVEVLPFHKLGEYKWKELGHDYELAETQPPSSELVQEILEIFRKRGLNAVV